MSHEHLDGPQRYTGHYQATRKRSAGDRACGSYKPGPSRLRPQTNAARLGCAVPRNRRKRTLCHLRARGVRDDSALKVNVLPAQSILLAPAHPGVNG